MWWGWAGAGGQKAGEICLICAAQEPGAAVQDVLQHTEVAQSPCFSCLPTLVFCFPSAVGEVWFEAGPCTHLLSVAVVSGTF